MIGVARWLFTFLGGALLGAGLVLHGQVALARYMRQEVDNTFFLWRAIGHATFAFQGGETRMALAMCGVTDRHLHRQCQRRTVCARSSKRRRHRRARVPVVHGGGGKRQRRARRMVMTCASARVTRNARDARDARCNRPLSHPPSPTPHLVRAIERRASAAAAATRACPGGTEIGDDARDAR